MNRKLLSNSIERADSNDTQIINMGPETKEISRRLGDGNGISLLIPRPGNLLQSERAPVANKLAHLNLLSFSQSEALKVAPEVNGEKLSSG